MSIVDIPVGNTGAPSAGAGNSATPEGSAVDDAERVNTVLCKIALNMASV